MTPEEDPNSHSSLSAPLISRADLYYGRYRTFVPSPDGGCFIAIGPQWPVSVFCLSLIVAVGVFTLGFMWAKFPPWTRVSLIFLFSVVLLVYLLIILGDPGIIPCKKSIVADPKDRDSASRAPKGEDSDPRGGEKSQKAGDFRDRGLGLANSARRNQKFCEICDQVQPQNSGHCDICDVCILGLDHHCIMMGKCVAEKNMGFFTAFLAGVPVLFVSIIVSVSLCSGEGFALVGRLLK